MTPISPVRRLLLAALVATLSFASACGDLVGAAGEQGNVTYALFTDYEVDVSDIRVVTLVAGHPQTLHVNLTSNGRREARSGQIDHRVTPSEGATLDVGFGVVPNVDILATTPGTYTIETVVRGEVLDSIDLTFDAPDTMRLHPRVRAPWTTDWQPVPEGALATVEEGTEVSFVPEPLDATGQQLVGDVEVQLSFDPEWSVVPGSNLNGIYTNGWWSLSGPSTFYFIEPPDEGNVTATVRDDVNGIEATLTFFVEPVDKL